MKAFSLVALATLLGFFRAAAVAQELPDVFQVVEKIGEQVEFQDEVKAVSYSRSTDGYYLSFGLPYPAQVVSVWVSAALFEKLPGQRELVGRTVRIRGQLEKSLSGPLVKLEAREQFQLLRADETVLAKQVLDGKMDRDQFKAAVRQHFSRRDFETLEVLAEELRQSRERFSDGTWLSDAFFSAFDVGAEVSVERYASVEQKIADWEKARPGSPVLVLVKGGFHRDRAWKAKVDSRGKNASREGREGFERELASARQLLESDPAARMYPEYFAIMQSIAAAQAWPREEYFRLFAEATALERDYYAFYFNAAEYLLRHGGEKEGEWERFAEQQRLQRGAGGAGDVLYTRIAWAMKGYYRNLLRDSAISWEVMASGFDQLLKEYPNSRHLKNTYANFAWKADDRERLRKLLPEIEDAPDMNIWVNLENFAMAEKEAASSPRR